VTNPLNEELASLRTALLPGLLRAVRYSESRGFPDVALFETGRVFHAWPWNEDSRVPDQPELLAFAIAGGFGAQVIGGERRPADVYTATGVWRVVAHGLALGWYELVGASAPGFHPGRCARVVLNGVDIGHVGEIHPATASAYGLSGRVAAGELDLAALVAPVPNWQLDDPSVYPPVEFDLAFLVDETMPAASLVTATARAAADLLESARVFDQFRGGGLPGGKKSLAIRYVLRASDRTLEAGELAGVRARLIDAAVALGAELRGQR
jgi:phenylalanyl-tRNA synthetase beta chain